MVHGLGLISDTDASGDTVYFLGNGLGSTEALTDGLGGVSARFGYDAYGAVRHVTGLAAAELRSRAAGSLEARPPEAV